MGFGASVAQRRHNLTHYSRFLQEKCVEIEQFTLSWGKLDIKIYDWTTDEKVIIFTFSNMYSLIIHLPN